MLPITAMPNAPPSSLLVSDSADAAPARSGGAALRTMSVVNVTTGVKPREKTTDPATRIASAGATLPISASRMKPAHDRGRQHRSGDERQRGGDPPQARRKRGEAQHRLQILRDEEKGGE